MIKYRVCGWTHVWLKERNMGSLHWEACFSLPIEINEREVIDWWGMGGGFSVIQKRCLPGYIQLNVGHKKNGHYVFSSIGRINTENTSDLPEKIKNFRMELEETVNKFCKAWDSKLDAIHFKEYIQLKEYNIDTQNV